MLRSILALSFLSLGITVVGCDSDTGNSTTGSGSGAAAAEACAALASAVCAKTQSCSSYAFEMQYADMAQCKERVAAGCPERFEVEGSKTTPAEVKGCADSFAAFACLDFLAGDLPAACDPSPGTRANGSLCGLDVQCASTQCAKDGKALCGGCWNPIAEGGLCPNGYGCARGLKCAVGKCVVPGVENDACSDTAPCKSSLLCTNGMCVKPLGPGESCTPLGDNCDLLQGLRCMLNGCQQIKTAGPGEPCSLGVPCKASGRCRFDPMAPSGTCVARCLNKVCTLDVAALCINEG
jgi:hypothetical protein